MAKMRCYANEQILNGIASQKEDIDQLKTDVTTIDGRLDGIDSILTTMQGDIDTINDTLDDFIKSAIFKVIGTDGILPSVVVNANSQQIVDFTSAVTIPTGYKMLATGLCYVESLVPTNIVVSFFYYDNGNKLMLRNFTGSAITVTNLWVGTVLVKE